MGLVHTYSAAKIIPLYPDEAPTRNVKFGNSLNLARGTVVGQVTAGGAFIAYANANSDGSEVARGILQYDISTDSSGNVTLTGTSSQAGGDFGQTTKYATIYVGGTFRTTELTGLDAAAVTDLGRLESGTVADGVLKLM